MSTSTAHGTRPRRPAVRPAVALAVAPVAGAALLVVLLLAGGVDLAQACRITLVVAVQAGGGAVLWRLARSPEASWSTELVGMGLALGTLISLLGSQALLAVGLSGLGWLLPAALAASATLLPGVRRRLRAGWLRPPAVDEIGGVLGGIAVGLVFVRSFWRAHPLEWDGWWRYYVDIPHHEALATSLATWGPGDQILAAGEPIRYHWFTHGWAGALTGAASAEPFVSVTRVLPILSVFGIVCLVWAWARELSGSRAAPPIALVAVLLTAHVGTARDLNFLQSFTVSPSLGLSALWFLGAALVLTLHLRDRLAGGLVLLALLAIGCTGGKTSYAAVLGAGVALLAVASLWFREYRNRAWTVLGVVALALAGAFVALLLGSTGNLRLQAGATAEAFGVLPDGDLGVAVGTVGAVLLLGAPWAGVAVLLAQRGTSSRPEVWFALGAAGAGLLLAAVLAHPGASQLYFPLSAAVAVGVVSAWGLAEGLARVTPAWSAVAVVIGAAAGAVGDDGFPGGPAWAGPYLVWSLPVVLAVVVLVRGLARGAARRRERPELRTALVLPAVSVLAWGLLGAGAGAGAVTVVSTVVAPSPPAPAADAPLAWTGSHEAALRWLRENAARDDVVVTNRQCPAPRPWPAECRDFRWFLTAALGHRRTYVEGAQYVASQPPPSWVLERVALSRRFVDAPTVADARILWDAGVRWVVVDLASTRTRDWAPYAQEAFTTDTTAVLRLARP